MPRRAFAMSAVALMLATTVAACGSNDDDSVRPSTRGPQNNAGQATCVYIDSPAECEDSGVPAERWYQAPTQEPPRAAAGDSAGSFLMQLFLFQMIYSRWFSSPAYVNHYVVVEHRDGYRTSRRAFDQRYAEQERTSSRQATYRTGSGKTVTGDKVDPAKFAPAAPKNAGGDRGKKLCNAFVVDNLTRPGGGSGGGRGGSSGGRSTSHGGSNTGGSKPKPPAPKQPVGGDRGKGGDSQHGC
jgi:hypothetical protein